MANENNLNTISKMKDIINDIKQDIYDTEFNIMLNSNINLVKLYYRIGKILSDNSTWGNKFINSVSKELNLSFPKQKGFSVRNLKYMKSFYEEYKGNAEFVQLVAQIPWKHNLTLITKIKDLSIRKWYIEQTIKEGWSNSVLNYQIDTDLYARQVKNIKHNNFKLSMKKNSDLANDIMKDPYVFDLIELTGNFKEKELQNKMIENVKRILLELGTGFSFVGSEYKVTVGNQDFYIDLLFYHITLKCYIAVELKTKEFVPKFGSQLAFYLEALDRKVKGNDDNPSIGLLLCPSKNNEIVDFTLSYINKPVGISEYKIFDKLPKELTSKLPTEEELNLHIDLDDLKGDKNE